MPLSEGQARDFRALWLGQFVSQMGDQVSAFVLPTIAVLVLSASSSQVGLLNAVATIGYPCFGLFAGVITDRIRRRPLMIAMDTLRLLIFGSLPVAAALGVLSMTQLFVGAALASGCRVMFDVAYQAYLPDLLDGARLTRGNARLEASRTVAQLAGPSAGGGLLQGVGVAAALSANALSFLVSIIGLVSIRTREARPEPPQARPKFRAEIREGASFLWHHPLLRPLTFAAGTRNFGISANRTVLIIFMYRVLYLSAGTAGAVFAVAAVAAFAGAVGCDWLLRRFGVGRTLLLTAAEGLVWLLAPAMLAGGALAILVIIMFLSSIWLPVWNVTVTSLRQSLTDGRILGRVHATARTINAAAVPIGAVAGGLLAQVSAASFGMRLGLTMALTVSGVAASMSLPQLAARRVRRASDITPSDAATRATSPTR